MMRDLRTWLPVALLVSLALNLFMGGVLAGRGTEEAKRPDGPSPRGNPFMTGWALPDRDGKEQTAAQAIWERKEPEVKSAMQALHAAQRRVRDALRADPWNREMLADALTELRHRTVASQEQWHQTLLDVAEVLPMDERARLGEMGRGMGHGMGRGMNRHHAQ